MKPVFDYFAGGKIGVQERFAVKMREKLGPLSVGPLVDLETHLCLPVGTLWRRLRQFGEADYSGVNSELVEKLSDACELDVPSCFGEFVDLTPAEVEEWDQLAKTEQFICVGGSSGAATINWSREQRVRLFILLRALKEL